MEQIDIGKNIRRWRSFRGKKQASLAKEIGVSRVMLSRYENGKSVISLDHLDAIAKSLEVNIVDLINEEKKQ